MAHRMGNGYQVAIDWYTEQKEKFMLKLNTIINEEQGITEQSFLQGIAEQPPDNVGEITEKLVTEIEKFITEDGDLTRIRNFLATRYKDGRISKERALNQLRKYINKHFTPEYIKTKILSKLGTVGGKELTQINDNALLGKVKMLLSMGLRHELLDPSNYTKSTVSGILYEHAIAGGLQKYFNSIPDLKEVVQVDPTGAKGGKGDVTFTLREELFEKSVDSQEDLPERFEMQLKNYDIDNKLDTHAAKMTVGSNMELLKEFINNKNYEQTREDSIYFLSQTDRVIRAIGRYVFLYGYSNGNMKFTADLIAQCRNNKPPYALGFSNLNSKDVNQQAYINWIRQKS